MARCADIEPPPKTHFLRVELASVLLISFFGACSNEYDSGKIDQELRAVKNDPASVQKVDKLLQSHAEISGENAYHFYSRVYESALRKPYPYFLIVQQKRRSAKVIYEAIRNGGAVYQDYIGPIPEELKQLKASLIMRLLAAGVPEGQELRSYVSEFDRGPFPK